MNNLVKLGLEATIISSTIVATNEVVTYYQSPFKRGNALTGLYCNIASTAIGYYIGRKVSAFCVKSIDDVIRAYKEASNG